MGILKWAFPVAILYSLCAAVDTSPEDSAFEEYFQQKLNKFKLRLHEGFERARLQRHKRTVGGYESLDDNGLPQEHLRIVGTRPVDLGIQLPNVSCWEPIDFTGNKLLLVATRDGTLKLLQWTKGTYVPFTATDTKLTTVKVKAFVFGQELWLVCLHQKRGPNTQFVRLYRLLGKQLVTKQTIALSGETDIDVVRGATAHYLVTCVFQSLSVSGVSYDGNLVLYEWKNTQFDAVSQQSVVGARSVAAWSMDGPLYIAVAQQRDNAGELYLGSPVFIYNQRKEHELSYVQVMRMWQASKVNHFTVAGIHYLTFLTKQGVFLYWYSGDQFLEWQTLLDTEDADDLEVFNLPNGEAAIAVIRREEVMFFLETESATYNCTFIMKTKGVLLSKISFQLIDGNYFLFATYARGISTPSVPLQLILEQYNFVSSSKRDPLMQCLQGLEASLNARQKHVDVLSANVGRVWTSDKQRPLATEMVIVDGPIKVLGSVSAPKAVIVAGAQRVPGATPDDVSRQIGEIGASVAGMENELKNVVFKSLPQTIQGNIKFANPVSTSILHMGDLSNCALNGVPTSDLLKHTLKVTGDQVLHNDVSFGSLYVNQLNVHSINGVNVSDIMMTNKDQVVTGNLKFGHVAMTELMVSKGHRINGIDPSKIVTTDTPQSIGGQKTFSKLNVPGDLGVVTTTNGRDLSDFVRRLVPLGGDTRVTGQWTFQSPLTVGSGLQLKHPIDGQYSIPSLYAEAVDKHSHQVIRGTKSYQAPVSIRGNAEIVGTLNGIRPDKDLVTLATNQVISGNWIIKAPIHFKKNLNAGTVNGIDFSKEVVLRNRGPQAVYGKKIFESNIHVAGDIVMTEGSTINGVDPSELVKSIGSEVVYNSAVNIDTMVVTGNVVARKGVNDRMLRDLKRFIWLKSANQDITVPVKFGSVHVEGDLDTETINGISLDRDIVKTFGDEVIEGPMTFKDAIHIRAPVELAPGVKINGIDLSEVAKLVARATRNEVIHGNISFPSLVVQKDLHCETVNGRGLSNQFLLVGGEQVMTGTPLFAQPISVNNLHADTIIPARFNGVGFKRFLNDIVLQNSTHRGLLSNKHFAGGVEAHKLHSHGTIDGVPVEEMLNNVVLLNVAQTIGGTKTFQTPLLLNSLVADRVNGVDLSDRVRRVVRRDIQQVITGKKTVNGRVLVRGHVTTEGLVNGVHMKDLYARAMSRTKENLISAPMTFLGGIEAERLHLYEPAKLDGIPVQDFVHLREDSVLEGSVVFKNLVSDGEIKVGGLINGCNITKLYKEALYLNGDRQRVFGEKHFAKMTVKGNVHIRGNVNNIHFNELTSKLVTRDAAQAINGPLTFVDHVVADSLIVAGPVNGLNLTDLLRDAVTKSTEQVITGTKTLTNQNGMDVTNSAYLQGDVHSRGPVGGIRIEDLSMVVTEHGSQVIAGKKSLVNVHVTGNVLVQGKLNSVRIPEDLVLLNTRGQQIPGKTILAGPATIAGSLDLDTINDVDLHRLLRERVTLSTTQRVRSRLVFRDDIVVQGNLQALHINSIPREHLVVQSNSHQLLSGTKTFVQAVTMKGNLTTGRVNGFDLSELYKDVVFLNRPQEIPHTTVFAAPIEVQGNIEVVGMVNDIDVQNLQQHFAAGKQIWRTGVRQVARTLDHHDHSLRRQYAAYKAQATSFSHLELFQTMDIPSRRILTSPTVSAVGSLWAPIAAETVVLWTARPTRCQHGGENCCEEFSSELMTVESDGKLSRRGLVLHRRYFPFTIRMPGNSREAGFVAWTNSTSSRRGCEYAGSEELVMASVSGDAQLPFEQKVEHEFRTLTSPFVEDVKLFDVLGTTYVVVAHSFNKYSPYPLKGTGAHVEVFRLADGHWSHAQSLNTSAAVSIDLVDHHGSILLSVASSTKVGILSSWSTVYVFNKNVHLFVPLADIPTSLPSSTLFVTWSGRLLVVFANEKTSLRDHHSWLDSYTEPVSVYQYVQERFELLQNIPLHGVNCMERFKFAGDLFLVLGSRHFNILALYKWRGYSKFERVQSLSIAPVALRAYWSRGNHLFLAAATVCGKTEVLRAVQQGQCLGPFNQREIGSFRSISRRLS